MDALKGFYGSSSSSSSSSCCSNNDGELDDKNDKQQLHESTMEKNKPSSILELLNCNDYDDDDDDSTTNRQDPKNTKSLLNTTKNNIEYNSVTNSSKNSLVVTTKENLTEDSTHHEMVPQESTTTHHDHNNNKPRKRARRWDNNPNQENNQNNHTLIHTKNLEQNESSIDSFLILPLPQLLSTPTEGQIPNNDDGAFHTSNSNHHHTTSTTGTTTTTTKKYDPYESLILFPNDYLSKFHQNHQEKYKNNYIKNSNSPKYLNLTQKLNQMFHNLHTSTSSSSTTTSSSPSFAQHLKSQKEFGNPHLFPSIIEHYGIQPMANHIFTSNKTPSSSSLTTITVQKDEYSTTNQTNESITGNDKDKSQESSQFQEFEYVNQLMVKEEENRIRYFQSLQHQQK